MHPLLRTLTATALVGCTLTGPNTPADHPEPAPAQLHTADTARPIPASVHRGAEPPRALTLPTRAPAPEPTAPARALQRLPQRNVTTAVARQARRIIQAHGKDPFGTEIPFEADGKSYVARIEQHYHPPGGEKRPWGPHPGVSVFVTNAIADTRFPAN